MVAKSFKRVYSPQTIFGNHLISFQPLSDVVMHVERGYRMEAPEGCPPEVYAIMTESWAKEPENRPTFEEIRKKLENLKAITV